MELNVLERTAENRVKEIKASYDQEFRNMLANVSTDRAWYNFLIERRQKMLSENSRLMVEAIENGQEVVGLTEDIAITIGPFAIAEPSPASSVSESPSYSFVELAEQSEHLLRSLSPSDALSAGGCGTSAKQSEKNQAWDFMTLGSALARTDAIPKYLPGKSQQRSGLDLRLFPVTTYPAYRGDFTMSGALSPLDEKPPTFPDHHSRRLNGAPPVPPIPRIYLPGEVHQASTGESTSVPSTLQSPPGEGMLSGIQPIHFEIVGKDTPAVRVQEKSSFVLP
jgi:hypothetical protein